MASTAFGSWHSIQWSLNPNEFQSIKELELIVVKFSIGTQPAHEAQTTSEGWRVLLGNRLFLLSGLVGARVGNVT